MSQCWSFFLIIAAAVLIVVGALTCGFGFVAAGAALVGVGLFAAASAYHASKNQPTDENIAASHNARG